MKINFEDTIFTETVKMEMGLDKCAVLHVKRGKLVEGEAMLIQQGLQIQRMGPEETYKYLGIQQGLEIKTAEARDAFKTRVIERVKKVLQSELNAKSTFTAIKAWAMPCLAYSFGVIKWSTTELRALDTQIRVLLTRYGMHHPHASVTRLYMPRNEVYLHML